MKCGNCEKNIPDGSKFCMYCGSEAQVGLTCHYCGFMGIPLGAFFCPACGARLRQEANVAWDTLKIGDYYYSDGTFSSQLDKSKTCVGVVFSLETTEIEKAYGWTHGQIVALEDAGNGQKYRWGTVGKLPAPHTFVDKCAALQDRNGYLYTHSNYIDKADFEAFNIARHYSVLLPECTSGWYLPSLGQWRNVLGNLGKVTFMGEAFFYSEKTEVLKRLAFIDIKDDSYWSSSAEDVSNAWNVNFTFGYIRINRQCASRVRSVAAI